MKSNDIIMKRLQFLKALVHIAFILSFIGLIFMVPTLIIIAFMPGQIPFTINGEKADSLTAEYYILLVLMIIGYAFFVYALHLFRKVLDLFSKRKIFHDDVIKHFDQIGKAVLIGYLISAVPAYLYNLIVEGDLDFTLSFSFNTSLLILGLSLFCMVLSEVFLIAKTMKEENDLTI